MKKFAVVLSVPLLFSACAYFQNPDSGEPVIDGNTQRPVNDVVACMTQEAAKHHATFKTTHRFYAGKRHADNLWIEGASKTCAP
jgi:hypothetical protein